MMEQRDPPPPAVALYLVLFDPTIGCVRNCSLRSVPSMSSAHLLSLPLTTVRSYTIAWHRAIPGLDLAGVEFRSLPSGLHAVDADVVYFLHRGYVGVSVFAREEADTSARGAGFVAVGVLLAVEEGRLGRAWRRVGDLRRLIAAGLREETARGVLDRFWEDECCQGNELAPAVGGDVGRTRALSVVTGHEGTETGAGDEHPAHAVETLLDVFGPLVFPLHRLALLRKRILFLCAPPVQQACHFAYVVSVLSRLPTDLCEALAPDVTTASRLRSLYCVGIHDIPDLEEAKTDEAGWIACTTDDILRDKTTLYDVLVEMGGTRKARARWPVLRWSDGTVVKATQRDWRRYRLLRTRLEDVKKCLEKYHDDPHEQNEEEEEEEEEEEDDAPLLRSNTTLLDVYPGSVYDHEMVEPVSWTRMALEGLMWWASAGEMDGWESDEARADRSLFDDFASGLDLSAFVDPSDDAPQMLDGARATATVVTAYFHRLTTRVFSVMADMVEEAEDNASDQDDGDDVDDVEMVVGIAREDITDMGLEPWSGMDQNFVREALRLYFGRANSVVAEAETTICGLRIC